MFSGIVRVKNIVIDIDLNLIIDLVRTAQQTLRFSDKISKLMMYWETKADFVDSRTKYVSKLRGCNLKIFQL